MQKETWSWTSATLSSSLSSSLPSTWPGGLPAARLSRWGHYGTPVLLFPTAGGDFEEVERFGLIEAINTLVEAGRIKVFSLDGLAARGWLRGTGTPEQCVRAQRACEAFVYDEVVPHIRRDCQNDAIEIVTAGAAFGAFSAVATLCRHPDVFRAAIALSGSFDVSKYLRDAPTAEVESVSPLHYVPHLPESPGLTALRRRFVHIACGEGDFEQPSESLRLAQALGTRGVPNHLDLWGRNYPHAWATWREMLPKYLTALA